MSAPLCLRHRSAPVAAVCKRCGEGLCDACWAFLHAGRPLCACCVQDLSWGARRPWTRFAVALLVAGGLAFWLSRHVSGEIAAAAAVALALLAVLGGLLTRASAARARADAEGIARREEPAPMDADPLEAPAHPYRARLGRVAVAAPAISGRASAVVAVVLLVVSAVLVPVSLKLPRWVELELVLAVWWALAFGGLSALLYRGLKVREDHEFRVRWNLPRLGGGQKADSTKGSSGSSWLQVGDPGCADAEGCLGLIVGLLLAVVAVAAAWLFVELVFPALFFLLYWLVMKAVARVVNDRHGCAGSVGRSALWGALWATAYTVPIGLVVWAVHALAAGG